jgi:hypothetical protein
MKTTNQYKVTLSSESWFLLAETSEDAAWKALELAEMRKCKLINVSLIDD